MSAEVDNQYTVQNYVDYLRTMATVSATLVGFLILSISFVLGRWELTLSRVIDESTWPLYFLGAAVLTLFISITISVYITGNLIFRDSRSEVPAGWIKRHWPSLALSISFGLVTIAVAIAAWFP